MKHTKKRVAALLLTLAMVLSLMPAAFAADTDFPDMPAEDDPSYAAVKSAVDNEIMTGENGQLNLEGTILRSTVSKMVVTAFAAKGEADLSSFGDVNSDAWYAVWMAKANQMGIMTGTSGMMRPGDEVTLQEVATMLVRALGLEPGSAEDLEGVPGAEDVADWAVAWVAALVKAGYISDVTGANQPMTRGAFAEVIYNVSGKGNYVNEGEITEDVDGNIVITSDGVSLKGITVKGDVIIADGVDAGSINLDGVKIEGRLVVRGGSSVELKGSTASATVIAKTFDEVTVKADSASDTGAIAVAGTNGKTAEKVTLDMAEPNVSVDTDTSVAIQNATGGSVTMNAANVSVTVESGTLDEITVPDGMESAKIEVAEGATIENITTNTDITVTGEGTVSEVTGSGVVSDEAGEVIGGGGEPAEVPTVSSPAAPVDPDKPTNEVHVHNWAETPEEFDANRHTFECVDNEEDGITGCGALSYAAHSWTETDGTACKCGAEKPVVTEGTPIQSTEEGAADLCEDGAHNWVADSSKKDTAATCDDTGTKNMICTICKGTRADTTPALGHNYVLKSTTAATCGDAGAQVYECANGCTGDTATKEVEIPATGNHTWGNAEVTTPATCKEGDAGKGVKTYTCTVCSATETADIPRLTAHAWGDWTYDEESGTMTHSCTVEGCTAEESKAHTEHTPVAYKGAEDGDKKPYKAATCAANGQTAAMVCSQCGTVTQESKPIDKSTVAHTFSSAWEKDETGHWHKCSVCTTYNSAPGEDDAKADASYGEHFYSNGVCTTCGQKEQGGNEGGSGSENPPSPSHTHNWVNGTCTGENAPQGGCTCSKAGEHKNAADVTKGETWTCSECKLSVTGTKEDTVVDS